MKGLIIRVGSRRSHSGTSSRAGSGLSVRSDNRTSPTFGRNDQQGIYNGGPIRANRLAMLENPLEFTPEAHTHVGKYAA